jgi:predicted MFS family arabinose efflux permease
MTIAIASSEILGAERAPRSSLRLRPFVAVCAVNFAGMLTFYLLVTVVPNYAVANGLGEVGAGFTAGGMMLAAVVTEVAAPWVISRVGYRLTLAASLVLLGGATFAPPMLTDLLQLTMASAIRGAGFGLLVVAVGGLAATVVPADRRGEALALLGVTSNLPAVIGLPLGVVLVDRSGFSGVFAAGGATALVAVAAALAVPALRPDAPSRRQFWRTARSPQLRRPALVFTSLAAASSLIGAFVPTAATTLTADTVAVALLLYTGIATVARWAAGRAADRHGSARLIIPAVLASAAGMGAFAWTSNPVAVIAAAAVFGAGFGTAQAATSTAMFQAAEPNEYAAVSAVWNVAYDTGLGLGPVVFGLLATQTGTAVGFVGVAVLLLSHTLQRRRDAAPSR